MASHVSFSGMTSRKEEGGNRRAALISSSEQIMLIILLACMWVSWFDFGLQTTMGAFFDAMLEYYHNDRATTASVSGLFTAINQGCGMIIGLLIHKFGIAKISIVGSFLVPVGFFLSTFASSIFYVMLSFGVISALGVAMVFISSAAVVRKVCSGPYKKWLPLCMTMHSCCISFAGFTLSYLIHFLIEIFSLPGTFLIFSGILANNICVSILFFFVQRNDTKTIEISKLSNSDDIVEVRSNNVPAVPNVSTESDFEDGAASHVESNIVGAFYIRKDKQGPPNHDATQTSEKSDNPQTKPIGEHVFNLKEGKNVDPLTRDSKEVFMTVCSGELGGKGKFKPFSLGNSVNDNYSKDNTYWTPETSILNTCDTDRDDMSCELADFSKQVAFPPTAPKDVNENVNNTEVKMSNRSMCRSILHLKEAIFGHFSVEFVCVLCAVTLVLGTQNSYLNVIIDIFKSKEFSLELAFNVYIPLNTCALICRILPGVVTMVDPIWFVAIYSLCGSAGQVCILMSSDYAVCLIGVGMTGMTMGGVMSAATIVIAKSIDERKFSMAFGQMLTGIGMITTAIAPSYGAIRDANENYDIVLTTTAIAQAVGALLCVLGWILKRNKTT